jgi:hypothetical protein
MVLVLVSAGRDEGRLIERVLGTDAFGLAAIDFEQADRYGGRQPAEGRQRITGEDKGHIGFVMFHRADCPFERLHRAGRHFHENLQRVEEIAVARHAAAAVQGRHAEDHALPAKLGDAGDAAVAGRDDLQHALVDHGNRAEVVVGLRPRRSAGRVGGVDGVGAAHGEVVPPFDESVDRVERARFRAHRRFNPLDPAIEHVGQTLTESVVGPTGRAGGQSQRLHHRRHGSGPAAAHGDGEEHTEGSGTQAHTAVELSRSCGRSTADRQPAAPVMTAIASLAKRRCRVRLPHQIM